MKSISLLIAASLFTSTSLVAAPISDEIAAIEKGLRGSVVFKGDQNWSIEERMQHYGVPGVSIAVIKDFKIHWVKSYGVTDKETNQLVTGNTLFQAGSISKPVAAYGALKLVEQNRLSLDEPVNHKLTTWKIPENEFTKKQAVALKHLLNHSGGLTVHGFPGYAVDEPVPTVPQILDGQTPANTAAVRVDMEPETQMRYSGGGYTVLQQLVVDVTKKDYPKTMDELVLAPIKMRRSTYEQPLPPEKLKFAAAGYLPNKSPVPGKRHTYPEMAAAGLWTTAEDLAKFAIDVQDAIKGGENTILSQGMTEKMLTPFVSPNTGLGFFVENRDGEKYFAHGGWDEGFSANLIAHKTRGFGAVVMINSNHPAFIDELTNSVAAYYGWNNYLPKENVALPISKQEQKRVSGRYLYNDDMTFTIQAEGERLFMQYLGDNKMEVFRIGENRFIRREFKTEFGFSKNEKTGDFELVFDMPDESIETRRRLNEDEVVPFEYLVKGEFTKAEKAYAKLFEKSPQQTGASEWNILSYADKLLESDEKDSTLTLLKLSAKLFPKSTYSIDKLAKFYQDNGDILQAKQVYRNALKELPGNEKFKKALAKLSK